MAQDSTRLPDGVSRRKFMLASGAAGITTLAGCSGGTGGGNGSGNASGNGSSSSGGATPLTADGSSTVYPITNTGASYWNSNPEPGDEDYWPQQWAQETYNTDERLADFFASMYGYEPTGERSNPPYMVTVALSHSGTGIEGVMDGRVDIGDSSAPAQAELAGSDPTEETLNNFVDHVVGVDGQPIVASREVVEAGVQQITIEELRAIYRQEITNWSQLGGPDREILALGRAEGSGTDTAFRANVFGDPNAPISPDQRYGKNQQLQQAIAQANNAVGYIALAFVQPDGPTPPLGLRIGDTLYEYGKNLGSQEYPLSRDLHAYTWKETSRQEAAFINLLLSDFGQERFVAAEDYFKLPQERLQAQRQKVRPEKYE